MRNLLLFVFLIGCGSDFEVLLVPNYLEKYTVIKEDLPNQTQKNEYDFRVSGDLLMFNSSRILKPHKLYKEPFVNNNADAVFIIDDATKIVQDGFSIFKSKYNVRVKNVLDLIYYKYAVYKYKNSYTNERDGAFNGYITYSLKNSIFRKKNDTYFVVNYSEFETFHKEDNSYMYLLSIIYNSETKECFTFRYFINKRVNELSEHEYDIELKKAFDDIFSVVFSQNRQR